MNEYMKNAVSTHAWHEFIYCKNNDIRREFLGVISDSYPIKIDGNEAAMVYVDDFMLPVVEQPMNPLDIRVQSVAREYLSFTLVAAIVEQTLDKMN